HRSEVSDAVCAARTRRPRASPEIGRMDEAKMEFHGVILSDSCAGQADGPVRAPDPPAVGTGAYAGAMARSATVHLCTQCGHRAAKWFGRCPGCGEWNTLVEEA